MLLSSKAVRQRVAWQLKTNYSSDIDIRISLDQNLFTPLFDVEIGASFSEIFLRQEYAALHEAIPCVNRWIDLGSYAGFFSLWLEWQRRNEGMVRNSEVLLVDANAAMNNWIQRVIEMNSLESTWLHRCAAVGGGTGQCEYVQRPYMGSSLISIDDAPGDRVTVPIMTESEIFRIFPPPYDLIKVDIEGAEYQLLQNYPALLREASYLCIEWHTSHTGGGLALTREMAASQGFAFMQELQTARTMPSGVQTGVCLFNRTIL